VVGRHHQVVDTLPEEDGYLDVADGEAPRPRERDVVVAPAVDALGEAALHRRVEMRAEVAGHRPLVDRRQDAEHHIAQLVRCRGEHLRCLVAEERLEHVETGERGIPLGDVSLPLTCEPVEPVRVEGRGGCERGDRDAPIGEQRAARERVRSAAGDPPRREAVDTERIERIGDVAGDVGDGAAGLRRRRAVAGAVVADQANPARARIFDVRPVQLPGGRRPVVRDDRLGRRGRRRRRRAAFARREG